MLEKTDRELWHRAKVAALQLRMELYAWLDQAIKEKLEREEEQ